MRTVDAAGLQIGDDHPPRIMGVLNVSEESPYDPSVFDEPDEAARYVDEDLIGEGADIVDVGLESANKKFEVLSADQELDRLDTAVETLRSTSGDAVWSIETRYHEVAEAALDAGFDMVNDICGFADPEMTTVCAEYDVAVSKMASPPDLERPGAIDDVDDIYAALEQNGFTEKTILDPAFGGWSETKTIEDDRETFRRLREFRAYGRPLLVSINRKNFLRDIAGRDTEAALPVSLAATSMAVERGAHVIRTHDVAETRDAALVGHEFTPERANGSGFEALDVTTDRELARHLGRTVDDAPEPSVLPHAVAFGLPSGPAAYLGEQARTVGLETYHGDRLVVVGTADGFKTLRTAIEDDADAPQRASEAITELSAQFGGV
ncbi:dihydropteroate synthase [Natronomonas pharaonis DSM 2160]|uniref:dihydropteroate synthase n=1 Tax=Natronomonas pharaonis (strain ATCC 35678 / DSM 2160 / CIP 103997 / JCM 8858 / NBRC 14720 / NCIMB 2260 / Gabara) TaxID=348780 RepID=A0A1U7EXQ7_NATPD|nr:dihydropteroate synthase [Natronomonas pharaonis]CAI49976.1 dihydropteroate synthase [Natronomonas pharaonis DSM 2160]